MHPEDTELPQRFTVATLNLLPVLEQGPTDNLVIDYTGKDRTRIKVWVSRLTVEDGAPCDMEVTVERYRPTHDTAFRIVDQYDPAQPTHSRYECGGCDGTGTAIYGHIYTREGTCDECGGTGWKAEAEDDR